MTRILLAILLSVFSVGTLPAAIITVQSHPSSLNTPTSQVTTNAGPAIGLVPHPNWATLPGGVWIYPTASGDPSLPGYVQPAANSVVTFTHTFELPVGFSVAGASLQFLADDTATGYLNGHLIFSANNIQAQYCVALPPGCVQSALWSGALNPAWFHAGTNTFTFNQQDLWQVSAGVTYQATIHGGQVPEPGTFALMGVALIGLGFRKLRPDRRL